MKWIKEIFAKLWAVYTLLVFLVTMFIFVWPILVTYLIRDPLGTEIFRRISKFWMTLWLYLIGCTITVRGRHHFSEGQTYIVTCNHNSFMDIPLTTPFIPGPNKTIAKKSFAPIPFFGWIYSRGSVLVDRNSDASRRKSYEDMKKTLKSGLHMCIYPEGTRNRSADPLKSFYDGAFKLAVDTGKPIIPALIFNTAKVMPANQTMYILPHNISLHFLEPVPTTGLTSRQLREKVFKIMWDYYSVHAH